MYYVSTFVIPSMEGVTFTHLVMINFLKAVLGPNPIITDL